MLPPFIIEQIRRREEQERAKHGAEQPRLQLPIEPYRPRLEEPEMEREQPARGIVVIEL